MEKDISYVNKWEKKGPCWKEKTEVKLRVVGPGSEVLKYGHVNLSENLQKRWWIQRSGPQPFDVGLSV